MKIVFCLVKFTGGNVANGLSVEADWWVIPLQNLGHEVFVFELDQYLEGSGLANKKDEGALLAFVKSVKPDWVFMNDYSNDTISSNTWNEIAKICKTSAWFGDDNHRYEIYTQKKAKNFTHPITCDHLSFRKYLDDGYKAVIQSQWGTMDFGSVDEEKTDAALFDATFIGTFSEYRKAIHDYLIEKGFKIKFYGSGWPAGKVSLQQMKNIFRTSKINLNLEKFATNYDLDFVSRYPRKILSFFKYKYINKYRNIIIKQIKARHFEINMCRGFQLSEYTPFLEKYYYIGKEIVTFGNNEDLYALMRYYLDNSDERIEIAANGYMRAVGEHTFEKRLSMVIERLG